jgi:diacylglycerol O-acyltransferase
MPPLPVPADLSPNDLSRAGLSRLPWSALTVARSLVGGAAGVAGRLARNPATAVSDTVDFARSVGRMLTPRSAEPSPLLRRRGVSRRTVTLDVQLDDLRRAAKSAGGSVNDAYLAALSGALRRYHEELGVPVEALPMAIPVSLRTEDDPAGGNRFAGVTLAAPISETDPAERMRLIREQIVAGRQEPAIDLMGTIAPALSRLPGPILDAVSGMITPPDVQASNVPGYHVDTFIAGARVERQYGLGPLPGVAMMVVLVSRAGVCTVAARYDTASITDSELLARSLRAGFDEVISLGAEAGPVSR